jgi:5-methyltetrahydropteroyltriglutamate--homocysteine methyltransferase
MQFGKQLPTMGIGSYATPGWFFPFREAMSTGRAGPADIEEAFDDATRIVIADQIEAGVDVISDGELRRQRFVYEMYDRIRGLERQAIARRLGVPGYDRAPKFIATDRIGAPDGLGLVREYTELERLAPGHLLKIAFPGPLTFARNIEPGAHYGSGEKARHALMEDIIEMLAREVEALTRTGCEFIQIDEPGLTNLPMGIGLEQAADCINRTVGAHADRAAVHVCYGNNASRPYAPRGMARLLPAIERLTVPTLLLEFANREMSEVELLGDLSRQFVIAAGVIDVKSFHEESAGDVAERITTVLEHVPADRLIVTADCGFSAIPRWLARMKMNAMTAGADLIRRELPR